MDEVSRWLLRQPAHGTERRRAEPHRTPVYFLRNAVGVTLRNCKAQWGRERQEYWSYALEAENVKRLTVDGFEGQAALPERDPAQRIV